MAKRFYPKRHVTFNLPNEEPMDWEHEPSWFYPPEPEEEETMDWTYEPSWFYAEPPDFED